MPGLYVKWFKFTKRVFDHHGDCGGILCIDDYANIHCRKCNKEAHITKMKFLCPRGIHNFEVPSSYSLIEAISSSAQMVNASVNYWFISVIKYIG